MVSFLRLGGPQFCKMSSLTLTAPTAVAARTFWLELSCFDYSDQDGKGNVPVRWQRLFSSREHSRSLSNHRCADTRFDREGSRQPSTSPSLDECYAAKDPPG